MANKKTSGTRKKTGKKTASKHGSTGTTRKARRPGRKAAPAKKRPGLLARLWRWGLLAIGLGLGLLIPWTLWLNHVVVAEFEGRKWDLPSRVYARPLSLYSGLRLSPGALQRELDAAGYRRVDNPDDPGEFSSAGGRFEIHRRQFRFDDGVQEALRFRVSVADGQVTGLASPAGGAELGLVRLDPAEIASIYPLHEEDRSLVSLADVPELLVTGLQAVEDRQFKHHYGVDPRGIARAMWANLRAGGAVQGGSTLTQQLVKNFYLSNERTLPRKINEALMALLLEWHYDKADILEAYLNEVFLGQQGNLAIHGFARGSEYYFGQPLDTLQPDQVALLVGLVRGASYYNPRRNPERALERRNRVLDVFAETGLLAADEAARWKARPLGVTDTPGFGRNRYAAFVDLVRDQLQRDYREDDLRSEGLRIFTTLAPSAQAAAEDAVSRGLDDLGSRGLPNDLQGALVLADVDSGEVRALVGDRYPNRRGFNRALNARRQVGSVIKPLVYLLALEHPQSYSWLTRIEDEPISLVQPDGSRWTPDNYDKQSHGEVSLLEALTRSYNQATVRLGMQIGVNHLVTRLQRLGIEHPVPAVPSTFLGAVELTPLEVTQLYQSIAAGGYSVPLRAVTAVQTPAGETLNRYPLRLTPQARRDAIAVLNYGLTRVVTDGTASALPALVGAEGMAGKTGTTNERRDSWFVGYTRDLVGVAWVGLDDNRPAGVTGANAAMRVWAGLFRQLPVDPVSFDLPEGASWRWVDPVANTLSEEGCDGAIQMPFVAGSEPATAVSCGGRYESEEEKSFWRKWFDKD
ncbi:penicillin-binding protein 1B [Marinihelvus fidelis]|uniref:Penicillin-binding protein 1B n=1 Tax=Marinihelvus fidelis TaxID=2613842 RepID=A0A5N0TG15_9GAMM|nr:penicillin-binding protein 1B [Marinihelvus fidelis]KAA9133434.1 penicillin-binding protein 1B [Marinihelvus fidelis]